jgi:hypothetical protein
MRSILARASGLLAIVAAASLAAGCNLIFGVGDPVLDEPAKGGGGAATVGTGGTGQGGSVGQGGDAPSCVGVICDDGNLCTSDFCNAQGDCAAQPNDAAMPEQVAGDCVERICEGGLLKLVPLDTDLPPDDGNPCTTQTCVDGQAVNAFESMGTACNGMGQCDGAGLCSTCQSASQCGLDTECATFSCNGQCGVTYEPVGTEPTMQVAHDCNQLQCTGDSAVPVPKPLDTDLEDDGNDCTKDACVDGAPSHPPFDGGTPCSTGVCDGAGLCKQCFDMTQCQLSDGGELCLNNACGCKMDFECKGKLGRICLTTKICGCVKDADCQYPGSYAKYCDMVAHTCTLDAPQ